MRPSFLEKGEGYAVFFVKWKTRQSSFLKTFALSVGKVRSPTEEAEVRAFHNLKSYHYLSENAVRM